MASSFSLYALPSDDIVSATASVLSFSGDIDPTYGVSKAKDGNPATRMRVNDPAGRFIVDAAAAVTIRGVALINTKLAGATVKIEGADTNSWGAPPVSQMITAPVAWPDGFEPAPFKDLTTLAPNRRWWSIDVSGASDPWGIGEILILKNLRAWPSEIVRGTDTDPQRSNIEYETDHDVAFAYDRGTLKSTIAINMIMTSAERDDLESIYRTMRGKSRPFLFIRDKNVNEALFVKFDSGIPHKRDGQSVYAVSLTLRVLSFGLVL